MVLAVWDRVKQQSLGNMKHALFFVLLVVSLSGLVHGGDTMSKYTNVKC